MPKRNPEIISPYDIKSDLYESIVNGTFWKSQLTILSQHWWKSFFEDQTKNSITLPSTSHSTLGNVISEDNVTTTTTVFSITINEVEQLGSGFQTYYKKNTLVIIHGSHGNSYVPYCVGKALSSTQDSVMCYSIQLKMAPHGRKEQLLLFQ